MTQKFANAIKTNGTAYSVRLASLRSSQDAFEKAAFRLMDLPQELRLDILEMSLDCPHYLPPAHEFLPFRRLRGPAQAGSRQLRLESGDVLLRTAIWYFDSYSDLASCIQQMRAPSFSNFPLATHTGVEAIRSIQITAPCDGWRPQYMQPIMPLVVRCPNVRELTLGLAPCPETRPKPSQIPQTPRTLLDMREEHSLDTVLELCKLQHLRLVPKLYEAYHLRTERDDIVRPVIMEVKAWLEKEFQKRKMDVTVTGGWQERSFFGEEDFW